MKVLKVKDGIKVPLSDIKELQVRPERRVGSYYQDEWHCWQLEAILNSGDCVILYEAPGFDNKTKNLFFSHDAVKGPYYELTIRMRDKIHGLIREHVEIIDVISL